ncbi:MAG TPA: hypothetical protein DD473_10950 [Planctomycetaceae bacterium]|nr:hypothetical protein [Planctomycetaceae bacterium]
MTYLQSPTFNDFQRPQTESITMRIVSVSILQVSLLFATLSSFGSALGYLAWPLMAQLVMLLENLHVISSGSFSFSFSDIQWTMSILFSISTFFTTFFASAFVATLFNFLAPTFGGLKIGIADPQGMNFQNLEIE